MTIIGNKSPSIKDDDDAEVIGGSVVEEEDESIKEQYPQTLLGGSTTVLLELKELRAKGKAAEENIKTITEKINKIFEQLRSDAVTTDRKRKMEGRKVFSLCSDMIKLDRKRKSEEEKKVDTDRKRVKLEAQLLHPTNLEAQLRTSFQRHEAASRYTMQ